MNEEMNTKVYEAELFIREKKYTEALGLLMQVLDSEPDNGRAYFNLGNIYLANNDGTKALLSYEKAIQNSYTEYGVYINQSVAGELNGKLKFAEDSLQQALKNTKEEEDAWNVLNALGAFYYRNKMLMKAERIARKQIMDYPKQYQGHHFYFQILSDKKRYDEIHAHFEKIKPDFKDNPYFIMDQWKNMENQGKFSQVIKMIDEEENVLKIMPEAALTKKIQLLLMRNNRIEARKSIEELSLKYGDARATFALMILSVLDQDYIRAANIGNILLQVEAEHRKEDEDFSELFYLTMFQQITVLKKLLQIQPSEEMEKQLEEMLESFDSWLERNEIKTKELEEKMNIFVNALKEKDESDN